MRSLKKYLLLCLWIPALAVAEVSEYQLDNGLKLLVKPDNRAPVAVSQVWYKVGSSYEHNGITGISHILEHMMFKGTENLAPGEFSKIIAENGGSQNAFTGRDYTAYFQTMEKERLEVSFRLEADRMRNLVVEEAELLKERDVVSEERRMRTDDDPKAQLREVFNATAFVNSPYHHPVIGWMSDINNYEKSDLDEWYKKWYAPNNAVVVVVGDVEPDAVYALAKQYFGPLKPEQTATVKPQVEVEQRGERYIKLKAPAQLPYLMMGWKVPVVTTAENAWEPYALDVLAGILSGTSSSRFSRELVREQQVAAGVSAYNNNFSRLDDMFIVGGTPAQGKSIEELQNAIKAQFETLKTTLVSDAELERVKTQVVASDVYERDSVFYQAMQLGMLETIGLDWQLGEKYVDNIHAVTAEQIQQVAQKYFIDDTLTVGELEPTEMTSNATQAPTSGDKHVR
ncbi:M16 family metallopeptidase [Methylophaga sp. OBS3]|uniref:M16 family metallopeptidase n=1 Tax=Methylophaga sp. OBS3 TaxID=2991934 RepID=UPI0022583C01|nr:pitrilysin family protein [Methylophaga sp. OBS3]MCX4190119.1 insulinase family protein [Methylophaga sp. OBS3]